jgi:hypothetical protein
MRQDVDSRCSDSGYLRVAAIGLPIFYTKGVKTWTFALTPAIGTDSVQLPSKLHLAVANLVLPIYP